MKRKAHIDFVGRDKVVITTLFKQKTFNIKDKDNFCIDLVTLDPSVAYDYATPVSDFYAVIYKSPDNDPKENPEPSDWERADYYIQVWAKVAASRYSSQTEYENLGFSYPGSRSDVSYRVTLK